LNAPAFPLDIDSGAVAGTDGVAGIHLLKAYALVPMKLYKDAATELQAFLSHAPRGQEQHEGAAGKSASGRGAESRHGSGGIGAGQPPIRRS
jgi:hypothetical protein